MKPSKKVTKPILKKKRLKIIGKSAEVTGDTIKITFRYDPDLLKVIRSLPGRKWVPEGKYWTCPVSIDAAEILKLAGFKLDASLHDLLAWSNISINELPSIEVPGLKRKLYPFQNIGVSFLSKRYGRALIADEMGLGKTVQSLAYLQLKPRKRPVVIVCPSSLKLNWKRECRRWLSPNPTIQVLSGQTPYKLEAKILIINYDVLQYWVKALKEYRPKVIITDECHYYKSNNAARTLAVKQLAKGVRHFIALSGTPIVNRPVEIFNAINLVNSKVAPSYFDYAMRYCGGSRGAYGLDVSGATNMEELHKKLSSTIMIRRLKKDVIKDLPDKTRSFIPMELDNWTEYVLARSNFIKYVKDTFGSEKADQMSGAEQLAQIEVLRQVAVNGKLRSIENWVRNFLDSEEKLVLFAHHKFVIEHIMRKFGSVAVKLDGSCSPTQKNESVLRFQTDPKIKLFMGNMKAAGVGITLTASSNVAFIELPWSPGDLVQCEDRCHRIGQKEAVNIYYLLAEGTIEEEMAEILDQKRIILDQILDGKIPDNLSLVTEIIKKYHEAT